MWGVGVYLHLFLTLVVAGGEWPAVCTDQFALWKAPGTY
jgi:hypothetical protein